MNSPGHGIQIPHQDSQEALWSDCCLGLFKTFASVFLCHSWGDSTKSKLPHLDLVSQTLHFLLRLLRTLLFILSHRSSFYSKWLRIHGLSQLVLTITCQCTIISNTAFFYSIASISLFRNQYPKSPQVTSCPPIQYVYPHSTHHSLKFQVCSFP